MPLVSSWEVIIQEFLVLVTIKKNRHTFLLSLNPSVITSVFMKEAISKHLLEFFR